MGINYTAATWTAGEKPPASKLNTEIRDFSNNLQAAWTAYTPTLTNITLGNGTVTARYMQVGKTITVSFLFVAGSTTTYGSGSFTVSLPVTAASSSGSLCIGACIANPAGTRYACATGFASTTSVSFALPGGGSVSNTQPATWGTSGALGFTVTYEAA